MVIPEDLSGGSTPLRLSPEVAEQVRTAYARASQHLLDQSTGVPTIAGLITGGAGELSGDLSADAASFIASWGDALDVLSTSTGLIAGNVNNLSVDLEALDRGTRIDLRPSPTHPGAE